MDMAIVERRHTVFGGNLGRKPRPNRAVRVAHGIGQLHLFAPFEHGFCIVQYLRVEAVGHGIAPAGDVEAALVVVGVDLGEDRVQVEIIEMFGPAADLTQQFGTTDDFIE